MRVVIQRVKASSVEVDNRVVGEIEKGILMLLGVQPDDGDNEIEYICDKVANLRIFEDEEGKMNRSLLDIKGDLLIVPQFTLLANCQRGRRPDFIEAAPPDVAAVIFEKTVDFAQKYNIKIQRGIFGAHMFVKILNDGPVTIILESKSKKERQTTT